VITDFKSGAEAGDHLEQLRVYALLWSRDRLRNRTGRLATSLRLVYPDGLQTFPAPDERVLAALEEEITARSIAARDALQNAPPAALVSGDRCTRCGVRQLCDPYWSAPPPAERCGPESGHDVQVRLVRQRASRTWDGVAIKPMDSSRPAAVEVFVSQASLASALQPGMVVRVLGAACEPGEPVAPAMPRIAVGPGAELFRIQDTQP
jgi:hypothetical protein